MKIKFNTLFLLAACVAMTWIYTSCSEDNELSPRIRYVRVTAPEKSDSLIAAAFQGALVAIIGENLGDVREVWFNDLKASLTPTNITNRTIITSVPTKVPLVITNKMTLVFGNGKTLEYPFTTAISEPEITAMVCEFVPVGQVATIRGSYFYEPLTVTFSGGVTGIIKSVEDNFINVTVPEGAEPGPITVTTNFGEATSDFWFQDTRNIFLSSDPFTGWWNESFVVTSPGAGDPIAINGNYIRVKKFIGAWAWTEVAGGPASAMGDISKNIPADAILHPADYNFKFEVNTMKPYMSNMIKFNMALGSENNNEYRWVPPYDTKGKWQTVVIPFEEVIAKEFPDPAKPPVVIPDGYWTRILMHGDGDLDADISLDNLRVVPKTLD